MKAERGFTLIELLVAFSIIGFVITAVYGFYLTGLLSWQRSIDQAEYQQSARIAMDKIVRELANAREVTLHHDGREIRFRIIGDSRLLRFRLVGAQLVFDSYPTTIFYYHTVVALNITELRFEINQNRLITVHVGAGSFNQPDGLAPGPAYMLKSAVLPRNLPPQTVNNFNAAGLN